jgi:hypothetical protein
VIPALKAQIDAAIASTAHLPHYFWTGLLPPFSGRADSVEPRARDSARRLGGTTLEDTLVGINMPTWADQDQDSQDTWTYASEAYANSSRGVAYVFRGEQVRASNVFDTLVCRHLFTRCDTNLFVGISLARQQPIGYGHLPNQCAPRR